MDEKKLTPLDAISNIMEKLHNTPLYKECDVIVDFINKKNAELKHLSLNELRDLCHQVAKEHGWWDEERSFGDLIALVHSEVSEALEDYRKGNNEHIPEELADILIRVFDMCGYYGYDLEKAVIDKIEKNKGRPYRHGNKVL